MPCAALFCQRTDIHSKGLKFGLYTAMGKTTCQGYPALGAKTVDDMGYARKDAATFVSWCSPRTINQHTSLFKKPC